MGETTTIETTSATLIVDRGGRRVRIYVRRDLERPGTQLRRHKRARGLRWCRDCRAWLAQAGVRKGGLCRDHENARYREWYASGGAAAVRARVYARRRGVDAMPAEASASLLEWFDGRCAYCGQPAESWDHMLSVRQGGKTVPGNMAPACSSCNSSKGSRELFKWLTARGLKTDTPLPDLVALGYELGTSGVDIWAE